MAEINKIQPMGTTTQYDINALNCYNSQSNFGAKSFIVEGNANTFYPCKIYGLTSHYAWTLVSISRGYSEPAPDTWNTSTHRGGLTLTFLTNGDSGWGGNHNIGVQKLNTILDLSQEYCTMVGDFWCNREGLFVWLRGGNATYWITSNGGQSITVIPYYESHSHSSGDNVAPITTANTDRINSYRWINLWTIKNATLATKLTTARTISLTGSVTGSTTFDGSGNVSIATTTNHSHSYLPLSGGTMTGTITYTATGSTGTAQGLYWSGSTDWARIDYTVPSSDLGILRLNVGDDSNARVSLRNCDTEHMFVDGSGAYFNTQARFPNGFRTGSQVNNSGSGVQIGSDGGIEIYHSSTPFIDFHYQAQTHDYSVRLICEGNSKLKCTGAFYGAVWNDYAEYRKTCDAKPGQCIIENGDGTLSLSNKRCQGGGNIISDTYGFAIGEKEDCETPIAVSGRVLAYVLNKNKLKPGDAIVSASDGYCAKARWYEKILWPERIIGIVSEIPNYDIWYAGSNGDHPIQVDGRIWVKVR